MLGAVAGYRCEGDAGLVDVGARYHDPQAGRFTISDNVLSQHPYLHCGHNPVGQFDPSGHDEFPFPNGGPIWDERLQDVERLACLGRLPASDGC